MNPELLDEIATRLALKLIDEELNDMINEELESNGAIPDWEPDVDYYDDIEGAIVNKVKQIFAGELKVN